MEHIYKRISGRHPVILDDSAQLVSAVLVPLVEKEGKCHILFEVRSKELKRQPGEICFPGGKVEEAERRNPLAAAMRETTEELGISEKDIEIIGPLDILVTPLSALIYPYAGKINTCNIKPNAREVDEVFFVPVDFFLNNPPYITYVDVATRYRPDFPLEKVPPVYKEGWQSRTSYPMFFYEYEKYFIWGLTGKILYYFLNLCWPDNPVLKEPFKEWNKSK